MNCLTRTAVRLGAVALGVAIATGVHAESAWTPPVFQGDGGRVALIDAVRITLENDPALLLDREQVLFRRGVLQELSGAFDWTLAAGLSYDYREGRLRDSTIEREREKRTELTAQRDFACAEETRQRGNLDNLVRFAGGDRTVEIPNDVAQQIDFLDALIAAEDNAAQRALLQQARANLLDEAIRQGTEGVGELAEACTELTDSIGRLGVAPEEEETATGRFELQLSKLFRSGVVLTPFISASYDHTQFKDKRNGFFEDRLDENGQPLRTEFGTPLRRFVDFGGKNIADLYRAEIGFDINVPLLRGRGAESIAASERAAEVDVLASELALRHGSSLSVLGTSLAYWQLLATQERVAVLERSVELQNRLVDVTAQLIEGDVLPRVEQARALAGQANSRAQLEAGRRDLVSARLALARVMGVEVADETSAPLAIGAFPPPPSLDELRALDAASLAARALDLRADRLAARELIRSGLILSAAARRELASRLDLALSLSAGSIGEDSFSNAIDRWTGPNGAFGLSYERSIGNRARQGRLGQAESAVRQREISAADLERNVRLGVTQTLASLEDAIARLEAAEQAAAHFQTTIDAEIEKLGLGASTLVDAIVTEQQKTGADLAVLAARQQIAALLTQLRFESGTLVEWGEGGGTLPADALTSLPTLAGEQP